MMWDSVNDDVKITSTFFQSVVKNASKDRQRVSPLTHDIVIFPKYCQLIITYKMIDKTQMTMGSENGNRKYKWRCQNNVRDKDNVFHCVWTLQTYSLPSPTSIILKREAKHNFGWLWWLCWLAALLLIQNVRIKSYSTAPNSTNFLGIIMSKMQ